MATGYPYDTIPLDAEQKDIRVLHFTVSGKRSDPAPLQCQMRRISLLAEAVPEYFAVSYTWGDASKRKGMEIDGHTISVPESADRALRYLRFRKQKDRFESFLTGYTFEITLWIDAICVNQNDLRERSQQVAMMGQIYSGATEVLVWLGRSNGRAKQSIAAIERVVRHCGRATDNFKTLQSKVLAEGADGYLYSQSADIITTTPFRASKLWLAPGQLHLTDNDMILIDQIYSVPWFTRVWILQEVCQAKRATVYYDKYSIPAWKLFVAAKWLHHGKYYSYRTEGNTARGILCADKLYDVDLVARSLENLLLTSIFMDSSEPRDKVFALLGILSAEQSQELGSFANIEPDYTKSVEEVYRDATRATILQCQDLYLPRLVGRRSFPSERHLCDGPFPSWVPRYDLVPTRSELATFDEIFQPEVLSITDTSPDPNILGVKGVIVDLIVAVGNGIAYTYQTYDALRVDAKADLDAMLPMVEKHVTLDDGETLQEAIGITFACGTTINRTDARKDRKIRESLATFTRAWKADLTALGNTRGEVMEAEMPFLDALAMYSRGRALFVTQSGRMGMGFSEMQAGDKICHLFGGRAPFVLREEGHYWRLLGDAYVYGLVKSQHSGGFIENGVEEQPRVFEIH